MTEKLRTGQVAKAAGVNVETLRFYERRGLLKEPKRRSSGYREYSPEAVLVVRFIKRAQELGFTLDEVEELLVLRESDRSSCEEAQTAATQKMEQIEEKIQGLLSMKKARVGRELREQGLYSRVPNFGRVGRQANEVGTVMKFACPSCARNTRAVKAITLRSLLSSTATPQAGDFEGFRFCPAPTCELVYFHPEGDQHFASDSLTVPVFQKSQSPDRLVCYCFEHSVQTIHQEVKRDGMSGAVESITKKCRNGEDRCPETNPQGSCCLGNVRAVVKAAQAEFNTQAIPTIEEAPCCCGSSTGES